MCTCPRSHAVARIDLDASMLAWPGVQSVVNSRSRDADAPSLHRPPVMGLLMCPHTTGLSSTLKLLYLVIFPDMLCSPLRALSPRSFSRAEAASGPQTRRSMLAAPDTERTFSDRENSNDTGGQLESQPTDNRIQAARGADDSSQRIQRMDNREVLHNSFWCSQFWVACWAEVVGLVCAAATVLLCLAPDADSLPFFKADCRAYWVHTQDVVLARRLPSGSALRRRRSGATGSGDEETPRPENGPQDEEEDDRMERVLDSLLASLPEGVLRARCWFKPSQTLHLVAYHAPDDYCAHLVVVIILFRSAAETFIPSFYSIRPSHPRCYLMMSSV